MFISFWNPIKALGDTIVSFFFGVLLTLDALVYSLISWVYQIILVLCNADILSNNFEIEALVGRIYIILGVVILFLVAYSLLKSMVNPDEALKGKKSPVTIVKDVIISVVLIAVVPTIFSFAMEFQQALLTRNTLGSIILGTGSNISGEEFSSSELIENGGMIIASGVLEAFLHPNYSECQKVSGEAKKEYPSGYNCDNVKIKSYEAGVGDVEIPFREFWKNMQENNNIFAIVELNNDALGDGKVTYYWIISTVAGVFVLFVLIQYCFDIAVRAVKLAVYELMAPIPILARIMPNEQGSKVFSNWLKATISTFVEVFIRLAILFFAVLIIKIVVQNFPSMLAPLFNGEGSFTVALFAQMFLILGIILFVKQAPEIIKEITGLDGGKYNPIKSAMQTAALLGGGVTAAVRNFNDDKNPDGSKKNAFNRFKSALGGAGSAAYRSMWNRDNVKDPKSMAENASKAAKNAIDAHNKRVARNARYAQPGESRFNDAWDSIKRWSGADKSREVLEAKKKVYDEAVGFQKELFDLAADDAEVLAFEGQKKAAQEKIIDRDNIEKEIKEEHRRQLTNAKRSALQAANPSKAATEIEAMLAAEQANIESDLASQQSAIDSEVDSKLVQMRRDQAATVDMYDNLVKVAKLKVIQKKLAEGKDGRYLAVSEKAKVFKGQHMNDEFISGMTTDLQEAFKNNVNPTELDKILSSTDSDYVKRQMDIIKGNITAGPGDAISGAVGLMADNEGAKKASGRQAAEIAKLLQEEKGKEAEKK